MQRRYVVALVALPFLLTFVKTYTTPELSWWTTHGVEKIRPYDPEPEKPEQKVKIYAARNEFEPFQVVLRAGVRDLDAVDVHVTELKGPDGAVVAEDNISIYLQRFLDLKIPSAIDGGTGEWPDPLVPRVDRYKHEKRSAFPFKMTRGRNQPIWIDVYIPRTARAGRYEGEVRVSVSGTSKLSIPVELEVWNFELPSTSSLLTTFGFSGMGALRQHFGKYTNDRQLYEMTFLYQKSALWHRISLHGGSGILPGFKIIDGDVKVQWDNFDDEAGPFMDGTVFSATDPLYGARATSISLRTPPALKIPEQQIQYWRQVAEHFRQRGWMERLFNYLWDEPKPHEFASMAALGETVRKADPELKNLVTAPLRGEWSSFVDIWTPTINCFEQKPGPDEYCVPTVARASYDPELAKGKKLWWYQACGTHGCYIVGGEYFRGWPTYVIDSDAIRNRIMQWMTWRYGIQGELYFATNEAYFRKDPWKDVHLFGGNGDGTLFYPGNPEIIGGTTHIPIESIRLKLIREGLEDYEYLAALAKLAGQQKVADLVNTLIRATYDFERDPHKLLALRESMGRQLNSAGRSVRPGH
jgi:hypothetical protein